MQYIIILIIVVGTLVNQTIVYGFLNMYTVYTICDYKCIVNILKVEGITDIFLSALWSRI